MSAKTLPLEGKRSLLIGSLFLLAALAVYLLPVLLSDRGVELQATAAGLAQMLAGSGAAAFALGKGAEAYKHRA